MSAPDARAVALDVLVQVAAGAASDRALDRALRRGELPDRDRGLATETVYGVLRRRQSLDALITPHSRRPLGSLDAAVIEALRLGTYQIVYLDRVPSHAAVATTVEAVKRHNRGAAGFVNAVLRSVIRSGAGAASKTATESGAGKTATGPEAGKTETESDVRKTATKSEAGAVHGADPFADIPKWWAERWRRRFGDAQAAAWFAATLEPAPLTLRAHPRRVAHDELVALLAEEDVVAERSTQVPGALRVISGNPVGTSLLRRGAFALRGEASQLVAALLPVSESDRVLDACAGRGGKTLQIAEDASPRSIVAGDVSHWRAVACARGARDAGTPEVHPIVADLSVPGPFGSGFSVVMVDAPCSGLGTVRRHPELKWRNTPARLRRLAELQRRILGNAADTVIPGGKLLYATCSTEPEENEEIVQELLGQRQDLELQPPELPPGVVDALVGADGYFRTYPAFPDLDGFFAALMVKTR